MSYFLMQIMFCRNLKYFCYCMKHKYSLDFVFNEVSQGVRTVVVCVQRYVEVNFSVE